MSTSSKLLKAYMKKNKLSLNDVGKQVGRHRSVVCRWLSGETQPKYPALIKLQTLYGIPMEGWFQ